MLEGMSAVLVVSSLVLKLPFIKTFLSVKFDSLDISSVNLVF